MSTLYLEYLKPPMKGSKIDIPCKLLRPDVYGTSESVFSALVVEIL